jgi:hypothetical protein
MKPTARSLITGEKQPINEAPGDIPGGPSGGPGGPPRRPGGPPRRMERPGGPGGPGGPEAGGFSPKERSALKDLIILDLLNALANDPFYTEIANVALQGAPITPQVVRHLMDEAPKYADKMAPEVNELMGKIAAMPMN